jgi:hypothetical protein
MKRIVAVMVCVGLTGLAAAASAERLEIGLVGSPMWLQDEHYEAFSTDELFISRFGLDIRSEVGALAGFSFVPLLGYRFASDEGLIFWDIDTELTMHDIFAGLRVRRELLSWLGVFLQIDAGALVTGMNAQMTTNEFPYSLGSRDSYEDRQVTWSAGAHIGLETYISRRWLESKGVDWFCFGGELSFGYVRRGDLTFDPDLEGGDDNALFAETLGDWGEVNLSGLVLQLGAVIYFI